VRHCHKRDGLTKGGVGGSTEKALETQQYKKKRGDVPEEEKGKEKFDEKKRPGKQPRPSSASCPNTPAVPETGG